MPISKDYSPSGLVPVVLLSVCFSATYLQGMEPDGNKSGPIDSLQNMLVINEDNSHFFGTREPQDMTPAGLHAFVDQYAGSAVTHLFLNANAMRASFRLPARP